jgi:hypothetical protein
MGASLRKASEPPAFKTPKRAASVEAGQTVYGARCSACHGTDGLGLLATGEKAKGYLFPPLWGPDSFNNGAGMHRVLTAARFIKARMPLGGDAHRRRAFACSPSARNRVADAESGAGLPRQGREARGQSLRTVRRRVPARAASRRPFQPIEDHYRRSEDKKAPAAGAEIRP